MAPPRRKLAALIHGLRLALVASLLLLLPSPVQQRTLSQGSDSTEILALPLKAIQAIASGADAIGPQSDSNGFWPFYDAQGKVLGRAGTTLPQAADAVGYRGPSNSLLVLDTNDMMLGVALLSSDDTVEHVEAVRQDADFFTQFQNWTWSGPPSDQSIDAVSGATLTSMAISEGILQRIGGQRESLIFQEPLLLGTVQTYFAEANSIAKEDLLYRVDDKQGQTIGRLLRTADFADDVAGYQGPTDVLLWLPASTDGEPAKISQLQILTSYDNDPYVRYCRTEYGFWAIFKGKTLSELATFDLQEAGVEGVSGATMTSLAVAETLVRSVRKWQLEKQAAIQHAAKQSRPWTAKAWQDVIQPWLHTMRWADLCCLLLILALPLLRHFSWFRNAAFRRTWLVTVIAVIGLWAGNLVSLALVAGWAQGGIPWRIAPVLAAVVAIAILSPPLGKSNPYCNHLCPHGAAQQLLRRKRKRTSKAQQHSAAKRTKRLQKALLILPAGSLTAAYATLLFRPQADLSSWEPFHAYLLGIAPITAIVFALVTLAISAKIPMAYCRLGCPTGRMLDYLRRNARSDKLTWADATAVTLLVLAICVRILTFVVADAL